MIFEISVYKYMMMTSKIFSLQIFISIFYIEIFIQTIMKIFDLRFINQKNCWLTLINFTFEKVLL